MQLDIVSIDFDFDGAKFLHRLQVPAQWYVIQKGVKNNNNNFSLELRVDKEGRQ
jgi:hypothetical protein